MEVMWLLEVEAQSADHALGRFEWQGHESGEAQLACRFPPFTQRRILEDIRRRDGRPLRHRPTGRSATFPDTHLAEEPGRGLRPVLRTLEPQQAGVGGIAHENG